jgi:MOSC domain-containing protein
VDQQRKARELVLGNISALARFPVKSLGGEALGSAAVDHRGLTGDRLWAVRDVDGKLGSGKSTRRFRRMPGLLQLTARYDDDQVPLVGFPDGRQLRADSAEISSALSSHVGRPVILRPETDVSHFDEGPLHLVTSSSIARLSELHGRAVDVRRLRANLVIDTGTGPHFDEDEWVGRRLVIGSEVSVRVREPMIRCVMVDLPQVGLAADGTLLSTLGRVNDTQLGLVVDVVTAGTVRLGDAVRRESATAAVWS